MNAVVLYNNYGKIDNKQSGAISLQQTILSISLMSAQKNNPPTANYFF